ncbi:1-deoxy-D-xylulose-5-phosphate reductoisomerase [Spiroplasma taiwanense]|uniref:1-deoxy-D-xylulose 5-phosphate reductoisomerase n=1 Tax=Spiroplasma taiwanense CT-1 TaxID=1276220 RepID=S5LXV1_9MOLU|nr:1-deoxy-D-xylulose-5-phosphate reductoisomerase [Spiroplasma taiwanense]AGR41426.1 1-deoxy-D-xylulose 5-phosphate reductoisomerase [Spiroplasma taiwanense CT-1]
MKNVILFGASGNIGKQCIEILKNNKDKFNLVAISVGKNVSELDLILKEFKNIKKVYSTQKTEMNLKFKDVSFFNDNINSLFSTEDEIVINALSGFFGLQVTLKSIEKSLILLNANKESFVTAGDLINLKLKEFPKAKIFPLDSEHCAIFQCLETQNKPSKIYLTASGGSFRELTLEQTKNVSKTEALNHPNWNMGNKITIDSATMFNKAFEILEAYHLFKVKNIVTLIHPQAIIHSMVEFSDFSIKAQLSVPDMKQVINYFLNYPNRKKFTNQKAINFKEIVKLELKEIDQLRFKPIKFALDCINSKNSKAIALNAANEICVDSFLKEKINFFQITEIVERIFNNTINFNYNNYEEIFNFDQEIRIETKRIIEGFINE